MLSRSGVDTLDLSMGEVSVRFPTQPVLSGDNYGMLCAAGLVSVDYQYTVSPDGVSVTVADRTYRLSENGELA